MLQGNVKRYSNTWSVKRCFKNVFQNVIPPALSGWGGLGASSGFNPSGKDFPSPYPLPRVTSFAQIHQLGYTLWHWIRPWTSKVFLSIFGRPSFDIDFWIICWWIMASFWQMLHRFSCFSASFGLRFFEHRFCNVFGYIFNKCLDRPCGNNLILTEEPLQKNKDSQVQSLPC